MAHSELRLSALNVSNGQANYEMTLSLVEQEEGIGGWIEYQSDLFDEESMRRMARHYEQLLSAVAGNEVEREVSRLSLMSEAEREQALVQWNETGREYPRESCIHQLFEAQAARSPEAVALVFKDEQLTYGELNRRANQLAHYLRGQGVRAETLVGVLMRRSVEMVVGILGVWKAGGAWVPLDPELPVERVEWMAADAGVEVVVAGPGAEPPNDRRLPLDPVFFDYQTLNRFGK